MKFELCFEYFEEFGLYGPQYFSGFGLTFYIKYNCLQDFCIKIVKILFFFL